MNRSSLFTSSRLILQSSRLFALGGLTSYSIRFKHFETKYLVFLPVLYSLLSLCANIITYRACFQSSPRPFVIFIVLSYPTITGLESTAAVHSLHLAVPHLCTAIHGRCTEIHFSCDEYKSVFFFSTSVWFIKDFKFLLSERPIVQYNLPRDLYFSVALTIGPSHYSSRVDLKIMRLLLAFQYIFYIHGNTYISFYVIHGYCRTQQRLARLHYTVLFLKYLSSHANCCFNVYYKMG